MPKIPTYISQRSIPAGSPNVPISAEAATAVPRAISGLGQDINQLGGQIQDREIRFQNELIKRQAKIADDQAELKAINSLNDWNQILRQRKLQNTERQFGDAVGIGKESVEWYNKEVQNHTRDLSPLAKAKFDKMSTGEQKSFLDAAYTYESSQMKEWKKSTWGGTFERYKDEISTFPEDSEAFNNIMQESFAYIDKFLGGDSNLKAQVEDDYNKTRLKAIYQHATTGVAESKEWRSEFDKIKGSIDNKILVKEYEKKFDDNIKSLQDAILRDQEKKENEVEKAHKKQIENNDFQARIDYYNNNLTSVELDQLARDRKISETEYNQLREKLRNGDEGIQNDPLVLGPIAEKIGLGMDASADLKRALNNSQIETDTYLKYVQQSSDKQYQKGLSLLNKIMKKDFWARLTPDINLRDANMLKSFQGEIDNGKTPVEAFHVVNNQYMSEVQRSVQGLPAPKYLTGKKDDYTSLEISKQETVRSFKANEMTIDEFNKEIELISKLQELSEEYDLSDNLSKRAKDDIKLD